MKRLRKRVISAILAIATIGLMLPGRTESLNYNGIGNISITANAETVETMEEADIDFSYEIVSGGIIVKQWNDIKATEATIPVRVATNDGKTLYVTGIDDYAFGLCENLSVVNVPYSLKLNKIGNTAFLTSSMVMDYLSDELNGITSTEDIVRYIAQKSDYKNGKWTDDDLDELTEKLYTHLKKVDVSVANTVEGKLMTFIMNIDNMGFSQSNIDKFNIWATCIPYGDLTLKGIMGTDIEIYASGKNIKFVNSNFVKGDANGDKTCNIRDAAWIAKRIAAGLNIAVKQNPSADYNSDGFISILDAEDIAKDVVKYMNDKSGYEIIKRESENNTEVKLSDAQGMPGDTVTLYVDVTAGDNFESMGAVLGWDYLNLTADEAKSVNNTVVTSKKDRNYLALGIYGPGPGSVANGSVASIDFTIPPDASPGTVYNINFVKLDTFATANNDITDTVGVSSGKITVVDTMRLSESNINLNAGDSAELEIIDYKGDVTWVSDNVNVATVENGIVTGVGNGKATIYAVIGRIMLSCTVKVTGATTVTSSVSVQTLTKPTIITNISTSNSKVTLNTKKTSSETSSIHTGITNISSSVTNASNTNTSLSTTNTSNTDTSNTNTSSSIISGITSSNISGTSKTSTNRTTTVSRITSKNTIISKLTTITSISTLTSTIKSKTTPVSITTFEPLTLSKTTLDMTVGEKYILTVNGFDGEIVWISTDEKTARVDEYGYVQALKEGKATIFAVFNGMFKSCSVNIKPALIYPDKVLGDANDDGKLTANDAAYIAKMLAHQKKDELPLWSDFNQDGKITAGDAATIAKYLAEQSIKKE